MENQEKIKMLEKENEQLKAELEKYKKWNIEDRKEIMYLNQRVEFEMTKSYGGH